MSLPNKKTVLKTVIDNTIESILDDYFCKKHPDDNNIWKTSHDCKLCNDKKTCEFNCHKILKNLFHIECENYKYYYYIACFINSIKKVDNKIPDNVTVTYNTTDITKQINNLLGNEENVYFFDIIDLIHSSNPNDKDSPNLNDNNTITLTLEKKKHNERKKVLNIYYVIGPSGAGKTHFIKNLEHVFAIDGGKFRESCYCYKVFQTFYKKNKLDNDDQKKCYYISNIYKDLWNSQEVKMKNNIKNFFYKNVKLINYDIFIPTTETEDIKTIFTKKGKSLGDSIVEMYKNIERDYINEERIKYIDIYLHMLYIYQHYDKCPYEDKLKCNTLNTSGVSREKEELKKYNMNKLKYKAVIYNNDRCYNNAKVGEYVYTDNDNNINIKLVDKVKIHNGGGKTFYDPIPTRNRANAVVGLPTHNGTPPPPPLSENSNR